MRKLGVDVGSVRVGVAVSDPHGILATPLVTLPREGSVEALAALVAEHEVGEVVVGLPRSLSGREGPAADAATAYAEELRARIAPVPVRMVDERLSTVTAGRYVRGRERRKAIDQAAAVVILQSALDADRGTML